MQTDIMVDVVPLPVNHPTFIPFDQALNMLDPQSIVPIGQSIELSTTISQSSGATLDKLANPAEPTTSQSTLSVSQPKSTDQSRRRGASVQVRPPFSSDYEQQQGYDPYFTVKEKYHIESVYLIEIPRYLNYCLHFFLFKL